MWSRATPNDPCLCYIKVFTNAPPALRYNQMNLKQPHLSTNEMRQGLSTNEMRQSLASYDPDLVKNTTHGIIWLPPSPMAPLFSTAISLFQLPEGFVFARHMPCQREHLKYKCPAVSPTKSPSKLSPSKFQHHRITYRKWATGD